MINLSHGTATQVSRRPSAGVRASRALLLGFVSIIVGCAQMQGPAPIEKRKVQSSKSADQRTADGRLLSELPPAPAGFYRVKRGDTLIGISLEHGVDWRELAAWNKIENANLIDVGQLLRVKDPNAPEPVASVQSNLTQTQPISPSSGIQIRPIEGQATSPASTPAPVASAAPPPGTATPSAAPAESSSAAAVGSLNWGWPANGQVITSFTEGGSKGIALAGVQGEAIYAAEQGRVVYSGNGLRGYGNLVIVKHPEDFITAYAHNRSIMVKEGQTVKRGQKIAELGMTDADRPMLHFEVRRGGKPIDPMTVLPSR